MGDASMNNSIKKNYINILHLSDFHFGIQPSVNYTTRYLEDRKQALELFFENFDPVPKDWEPDIIVISGDIGWAGKHSDYGKALMDFLTQLLEKTNLSTDRLIVCVGNHDKDTTKSKSTKRPVRTERQVKDESLTPDNIGERLQHFYEFCNFLRNFKVNNVKYTPLRNSASRKDRNAKFLYGHRHIENIDFIVLNSAWDCDHNAQKGEEDKGSLRVGSELFSDAWSFCSTDKRVVVTVLHHPLDFLHCSESEREDVNRLSLSQDIQDKSQIILSGHVHHSAKNQLYDAAHTYGCGTLHSNDTSQFGCQIIKIDLISMGDRTLPYTYGLHETNKMSWRWGTPSDFVPFHPSEYVKLKCQLKEIRDTEKKFGSVLDMTERFESYISDSKEIIRRIISKEPVEKDELHDQITNGETLLEIARIYIDTYGQLKEFSMVACGISSLSDYVRNIRRLIDELRRLYAKVQGNDPGKVLVRFVSPYGVLNVHMGGEDDSE